MTNMMEVSGVKNDVSEALGRGDRIDEMIFF